MLFGVSHWCHLFIESPPGGDHRRPQFGPWRFVAAFGASGRGVVAWRTRCRVTLAWFWPGSGRVFAFLADLGLLFGSATSRTLPYSCQRFSKQIAGALGTNYGLFFPGAGGGLGRFLHDFLMILRPGALFWPSGHHPGSFLHRGDQQEGPKVLVSRVLGTLLGGYFSTFGHTMRTFGVFLPLLAGLCAGIAFFRRLGSSRGPSNP